MNWMMSKVDMKDIQGLSEGYPETWLERWKRLCNTKYKDLTEEEKESDIIEANKIINMMKEEGINI